MLSRSCAGASLEQGREGFGRQLLFGMTLPEVIFSARLALTLKMEEAGDIFHPKLNGKWQVSDFCKFLSPNSEASADSDVKAPTWKSSKLKICFATSLKYKIFLKGGGEGKGQRGRKEWKLFSVGEKRGLYTAGSWRGSLLVQPLGTRCLCQEHGRGAGFSFSCHWSAHGASCSPGRPFGSPLRGYQLHLLLFVGSKLVYPVCKTTLSITALPSAEEQMLRESGSQISVTHFLLLTDT